jgi:hypothetical protein
MHTAAKTASRSFPPHYSAPDQSEPEAWFAHHAPDSGGRENKAAGNFSSVLGGKLTSATAAYEAKL